MVSITVNGQMRTIDVPDEKPILWVLREDLALKGAKYGCGVGMCGACTVLVDGQALRACVTPINQAHEKTVTTIEGLDDELGLLLKNKWKALKVAQCGYCQTGQIMAAYSLLSEREQTSPQPLSQRLNNLCRCGTYTRIHQAVSEVSLEMGRGD
ncbi:MAG: 2Fe-2S iron-sulfur cluster-binding protein [Myxococcota bacterium]|nr:2Fe-2S iron-sulfur cluster-binding protein [Myxococcota bacterium]